MSQVQFRTIFVIGPLLFSSIIPSLIFGMVVGQWGSNIIWGSVFGLGWCLSAFASGGLVHNSVSAAIGLAWGWLILVPLYFASGWLWRTLEPGKRRMTTAVLLLSFLVAVPADTIMAWDQSGIHLPDYSMHLAVSY